MKKQSGALRFVSDDCELNAQKFMKLSFHAAQEKYEILSQSLNSRLQNEPELFRYEPRLSNLQSLIQRRISVIQSILAQYP